MTKREFVTKSGDTFEWEETPETVEALNQLHETIRRNAMSRLHDDIRKAELQAPDYGVGK